MKVLVACEESGVVRDAFRARGHDAFSCDLLPNDGCHFQGDVLTLLQTKWARDIDLMIAHPPCTFLAVSGARWFKDRQHQQRAALEFVRALMSTKIPRWAIENPVSVISSKIARPTQIVQPWQFGHGETKATCLWLHGLSPLKPTKVVSGREARIHKMPPGPERARLRSRTYEGIAQAMAEQWG